MAIGNYNAPNSNIPRPVMGIGDIRKGGPIGRVKTSPQTRSFATDGAVPIVGGILMRAWERAFTRRFEVPNDNSILVLEHPWRVSSNGDDTATVAPGRLYTHRTNGTGDLGDPASLVGYFIDFAGDSNVTVTANGYIYALCDITTIVTGDDILSGGSGARFYSERQVFTGAPEVVFSTNAPATLDPFTDYGRNFAILLASVTLDSSIVIVNTQYVKTDIPPVGGSYCYEATP
jgi:hypothetical protein